MIVLQTSEIAGRVTLLAQERAVNERLWLTVHAEARGFNRESPARSTVEVSSCVWDSNARSRLFGQGCSTLTLTRWCFLPCLKNRCDIEIQAFREERGPLFAYLSIQACFFTCLSAINRFKGDGQESQLLSHRESLNTFAAASTPIDYFGRNSTRVWMNNDTMDKCDSRIYLSRIIASTIGYWFNFLYAIGNCNT